MTTSWGDLATLKRFLRYPSPDQPHDDDAGLQDELDGACSVIEGIKGRIGAEVITSEIQAVEVRGLVFLDETPIASVQQVRVVDGPGAVRVLDPADVENGMLDGWQIRSLGGVLSVPATCFRSVGGVSVGSTVLVDYTTGVDPIPQNYTDAAIELAAHLWNGSQNNDEGGRTSTMSSDEDWPARASGGVGAYALPFRVRELLGIYGTAVKSSVIAR